MGARAPDESASGLRCTKALTWRMAASTVCGVSASIGRHAASTGGPAGSMNSTRAGDSSSASWKSVSWPK